jgi:GT2 family glycosyltransferase
MKQDQIDIIMITHNRPEFTKLSLEQLLKTCDERMNVWLWHNGEHEPTLNLVKSYLDHPRVVRFHHNPTNDRSTPQSPLNEPTNWMWSNADGEYVTKVDDDCLMPDGWADTLRQAHRAEPRFGVLGCWRFYDEDFEPKLANKKIKAFGGGHKVMQSLFIEGSGYLMKRQCFAEQGPLTPELTFPEYCFKLAERGYIHGWYYPFLHQEHFDDPRSPYTAFKTDEDLRRSLPLSAQRRGDDTIEKWLAGMKRNARLAQAHPPDPKYFKGWRKKSHDLLNALRRKVGIRPSW